jgi:hypothetical protein
MGHGVEACMNHFVIHRKDKDIVEELGKQLMHRLAGFAVDVASFARW